MVVAPIRRPLVRRPAILLAAVLAGLGALALTYSLTMPGTRPAAPHPAAASGSTPTTSSAPPNTSATPQVPAPTGSHPVTASVTAETPEQDGGLSAAALQHALDASSKPDLPDATTRELTALARSDLTRDLIAAGTAAGLEIQASIARRHDGRTDLADVTLLYTDQDPANLEPEHLAVLAFAHTASGWVPVIGQTGASEP